MSSRLVELLRSPRESLDLEIKSWLDPSEAEDGARLAKAAMALANHGGGWIVIGLRQPNGGDFIWDERPGGPPRITSDLINAAIQKFTTGCPHCDLEFVMHPASGNRCAVAIVPGTSRHPVLSRRDCGDILKKGKCYIRKPGPMSEEIREAAEWSLLLDRCLRARSDELINAVRTAMYGSVKESSSPSPHSAALECLDRGRARWTARMDAAGLAADDQQRMPWGCIEFAASLPSSTKFSGLTDLMKSIQIAEGTRYSGWPVFVIINTGDNAPRPIGEAIEAWMGGVPNTWNAEDAVHADFWRIELQGCAYMVRGYFEDHSSHRPAGRVFDPGMAVALIGEALLYCSRLARSTSSNEGEIAAVARFSGLKNRRLVRLGSSRLSPHSYNTQQNSLQIQVTASLSEIDLNLPEVIYSAFEPFFEQFNFYQPSRASVAEWIKHLLSRSS